MTPNKNKPTGTAAHMIIQKKRFIDRISYEAGPNFANMPWRKLAAGQPLKDILRLRHMRAKNILASNSKRIW
jgi:hypothetical protein